MKYRVDVADSARSSIAAYARYLAEEKQAPEAAKAMLERIWDAVDSLEHMPRRCTFAPENEFRDYEIRKRLVGPAMLLFTVRDEDQSVQVIAFRHQRQQPVDDELPDS